MAPYPRQQRSIDKRQRVFEVALARFAEVGVEAARVEDIVTTAGVSWGTFFRYFTRKEDVLLAAAAEHFRENVQPLAESGLASGRPTREVALELIRAFATSRHPRHVHAEVMRELISQPQRFAAMLGEGELPFVGVLAQVIALGQERGEVRDDINAFMLAALLGPGTMFPTLQAMLRAQDPQPAEIAELAFSIIWRGLEPV